MDMNHMIVFLIFLFIQKIFSFVGVVQLLKDNMITYYLVNEHKNTSRLIQSNKTIPMLDYDDKTYTRFINIEDLRKYKMIDPIDDTLFVEWVNPDTCMQFFRTRFQLIQDNDNLVYNLNWIGFYWNPSIIPFKGIYMMLARLSEEKYLQFFWLDKKYKINVNASLMHNPSNLKIDGGDGRIIIINNSTIYIACTGQPYPSRMRIAEVKFHKHSNATVSFINNVVPNEGYGSRVYHKNWTPFKYNNTVLLIQYINPLEVVEVLPDRNSQFANIRTISKSRNTDIIWKYGDIRGGTGAKLLGDDKYLAFFHSRLKLECNPKITYFFGAYIFTSSIPFEVIKISRVPLYHDQFYTGPWNLIQHFDYVLYPMDFFYDEDLLEITGKCDFSNSCFKQHNITLSMGKQDVNAWIVNINLFELMHTLKNVKSYS